MFENAELVLEGTWLYDENGCRLTNYGGIEQYAYEYFQEDK